MTVPAVLPSAFLHSVGAPDIQHFAAHHGVTPPPPPARGKENWVED
jgi:hypothetical protein